MKKVKHEDPVQFEKELRKQFQGMKQMTTRFIRKKKEAKVAGESSRRSSEYAKSSLTLRREVNNESYQFFLISHWAAG